ncbi:MAG: thiol oxidoreductase [Verrucomicrobiae bacterium]|nr:thiol oxidoreductase [Verrucomicrobiae bacterium]
MKTILILPLTLVVATTLNAQIGKEVSISQHIADGEEFSLPLDQILAHGERLFAANWTIQEGGGRPMTKGTGAPLADGSAPLDFPRNFNRISAPDANSCAGCHSGPVVGGNGDIVANVFVLGQRFDFASFDGNLTPTKSATDESGNQVTLKQIANSRATLGMFGSGFIEMLARQMTAELQVQRDALQPGNSTTLTANGVDFGTLSRGGDGSWDTSQVEGLPAPSTGSSGPANPPSLAIRPFHQASNVISLRQFSNNAFNHHHGIQSTERFGIDVDADGDGFSNEMTRADVTAVSLFQAAMAVPGRVIPDAPEIEQAVLNGENKFVEMSCATCHVPSLTLNTGNWNYIEPNPYNPAGNLQPGEAPDVTMDLTSDALPLPRLKPGLSGNLEVPAFTDLKLHDITSGPGDPNREVLDMNQPAGSPGFFAGNPKFLTRKLWGAASKANFFHHGQYTTMREAILAHAGEAQASRDAFANASDYDRDSVIEFLKTLRNLPPGTASLYVDQNFQPRAWPPLQIIGIGAAPQEGELRLIWPANQMIHVQPDRQVQVERALDLMDWQNFGAPVRENFLDVPIDEPRAYFRLKGAQ